MKILTFGEIMGRIAPAGFLRFAQSLPGNVTITFAGAEANVAMSLAMFGAEAAFATVLPKHAIADACVASLRAAGIDVSRIIRSDTGRLGMYYLETGANQRPSNVIYDRTGSSIAVTPPDEYDWPSILTGSSWFHVTGITPSLSREAAEAAITAAATARKLGLTVSTDLNFRKKLWNWEPTTTPRDLAEKTMRRLLASVDIVIANESDCEDVLGIKGTDAEKGEIDNVRYSEVAREVVRQFPQVKKVTVTLRESVSASHNNWGGMLYDAVQDRVFFAPLDAEGRYRPYEIRAIVDRVGTGDSFGAALIFALTTPGLDAPDQAVRFAAAASCLAHSIIGDFNFVSRREVESLMAGNVGGRVQR